MEGPIECFSLDRISSVELDRDVVMLAREVGVSECRFVRLGGVGLERVAGDKAPMDETGVDGRFILSSLVCHQDTIEKSWMVVKTLKCIQPKLCF